MQSECTAVVSATVSHTSDCRVALHQNGGSFSESHPVNLVTYANSTEKSGTAGMLYCPTSDATFCLRYGQSSESPSKSNCPMNLAVPTLRAQLHTGELSSPNKPVNLASYSRKTHDCAASSNLAGEMSMSIGNAECGIQPSSSLPQSEVLTAESDIKEFGTTVTSTPQPPTYQNSAACVPRFSSASLTDQASLGSTHNVSSYHSVHWQPVLSPQSAQLMASAVRNASGQNADAKRSDKEMQCSPLLLQFQVCCRISARLSSFTSFFVLFCVFICHLFVSLKQ